MRTYKGFSAFLAIATCLALSTLGPSAHAQEAQPVVVEPPPPVVQQTTTTNYGTPLLVSGLVTFGISYGAAVVVAATSDRDADQKLFIPIAGPWIDLADRGDCDVGTSCSDNESTNKVLLVVDGVFQGAGALATVVGVLQPWGSESTSTTTTTASKTGIHVAPASLGRATPGIVAFGRF